MLSWTNILIGLSVLFIASAAAYLYWPQAKPESKIIDITNSLFDISLLEAKQAAGGIIAHPNESGTGSSSTGSSGKTGSSRSSKPHKSSATIPKGDSFFKTVIGSSGDPDDD